MIKTNGVAHDLQTTHQLICPVLVKCLDEYLAANRKFDLDEEFIAYARQLACSGKMVRATLLLSVLNLLGSEQYRQQAELAAAAIEIFGTGILIHDDIIDQSPTRRNLPTAHFHFAQLARERKIQDPEQFGISAAICVADLLFFIAEEVLVNLELPADLYRTLLLKSNQELSRLVLAEMEDVRFASQQQLVTKAQIYAMYIGKTGRYTGRWPLMTGAVLAGLNLNQVEELEKIGDQLGLVYQLSDDKLGLYGEEVETGKSNTSDVLSGKKTLYYLYLSNSEHAQKTELLQIYGNPEASLGQVSWLKNKLIDLGITDRVDQQITLEVDQLANLIQQASIKNELKDWLKDFANFMVDRRR